MGKTIKPDKESQITGVFSKMVREDKRNREREIRQAKREGRFYYIEHPELLSVDDQIKYYRAKEKFENGGDAWDRIYDKKQGTMVYPHDFMNDKDK